MFKAQIIVEVFGNIYFRLRSPITLSTWILTLAIPRDCSASTGSSWAFPFAKTWITSLLYPSTILSEIVKPLSATTVSPGNNLYKIPQFSERNLLEVRLPQASETKDTEEIHSSLLDTVLIIVQRWSSPTIQITTKLY